MSLPLSNPAVCDDCSHSFYHGKRAVYTEKNQTKKEENSPEVRT